MVNGFSLSDVRKLYLDELYDYNEHLFFNLEQIGKIKEGSYDKIVSRKQGSVNVDDTINELRRQLSKTFNKKQ